MNVSNQQSVKSEIKILPFISFLSLSFFLFGHSIWKEPLSQLVNRRLFFEPDAVNLLAATLAVSSLVFVLPAFQNIIDKCFDFISHKRFQSKFILIGALIAAGFLLWFISSAVLHHFFNSGDEHSCYFLAETLRIGKWWVPSHELSEFFNVTHVGNKTGKWFSVYPPGWPAIWALGLNFQLQDYLNPAMSVLVLFFFFLLAEKLHGQGVALAATLLTGFSAFFLFTGASYYSHTTCLLLMVIFSLAYIKWTEAEDETARVKWTIVLGLAVGCGLLTRYLTMAAFAAPFLIYRVIPLITRKRKIRTSDIVFFVIIGITFSIIFWQNYAVTGEIHKAPNRFDKSYEKLGFRSNYTPWDAALTFVLRFFYLTDWVAPFIVLAFIFFTFRRKTASVDQTLFHYSFYFPAVAYMFYYSWGGNQYGPRYFYEGWPFMALAVISQINQLNAAKILPWKRFFVSGLILSSFIGIYQIAKHAEHYEIVSRERKALYVYADKTLKEKSIVFINGFLGDKLVMSQDDAVRNSPQLDSMILYAHDKGEENKKLMEYYPDHHYYRGTFNRSTKSAELFPLRNNP